MLTKETWPKYQGPAIDGVKLIMAYLQGEKNSDPSSKMYQFGKTKIFLRYPDWVNSFFSQTYLSYIFFLKKGLYFRRIASS